MTTDLAELLDPPTEAEQLEELLADATTLEFPTTSWQSGSVPRTLLQVEAKTISGVKAQVAEVAAGGYLDAQGGWLTLVARGIYEVERDPGLLTKGTIRLTCSATAGPYPIGARALWISDELGRRFVNTTSGTLATGGTLDLQVEAEQVGSEYNVAVGSIDTLVLALPGVTVTNPDLGAGTWITQSGAGEQSDESLQNECRAKWGTLGTGSTDGAFAYWAFQGSSEVRRVSVRKHDALGVATDGAVTVVLAGESGTVSAGAVSDVLDYITARMPLCTELYVASCLPLTIPVSGTLTARIGSGAKEAGEANVEALGAQTRIGETAYRSSIVEQMMTPVGAVNFVLSAPATDVVLAWNEVSQFTIGSIILVEVP